MTKPNESTTTQVVSASAPARITAGPCSNCGTMVVGLNACPYCGSDWIGTRVSYSRDDLPKLTVDESRHLLRLLIKERDTGDYNGNKQWYYARRDNLIDRLSQAVEQEP